jgi:NDP-sugar pyrophosphorylase family protein
MSEEPKTEEQGIEAFSVLIKTDENDEINAVAVQPKSTYNFNSEIIATVSYVVLESHAKLIPEEERLMFISQYVNSLLTKINVEFAPKENE